MITMMVAASLLAAPIRLDEARVQGRSNVQALMSELDRQRAVEQVRVARGALLPQVTLGATFGAGASGPQRYYTAVPDVSSSGAVSLKLEPVDIPTSARGIFDLNVGVNQLIYDGARWAQVAQAGANADAAAGQLYEQQMTSELESIRRFYNLYLAQRTLKVLEDRVQDDQSLVERAQALFEAGRRHKDDVISAQVNLGNDRIAAVNQRSTIAAAEADLATWLAHPASEALEAVDPGTLDRPAVPPPAQEEALRVARENRPLLKALAAQLRAAEEGVAVARAGYLPRVSASLSYDRNGPTPDPFFTDITKQNNVTGTLNLSWTLFNGLATQGQVADARAVSEKARLNLEQSERELNGDVVKALASLQVQIEGTEIARVNLDLARDGLRLSSERFEAGTATTLEVRDAQLKLTNAELIWLQSRINVELARANLERVTGTLSRGVAQ